MLRSLAVALALVAVCAAPVAADDGRTHFRRTTPRADLHQEGPLLTLGVPAGRAWGAESELRLLTDERAVAVRITVNDTDVREAFARVAYYARATGRSRQIAVVDSELVRAGASRLVMVGLDPPPGAVAYRVRVLARLRGEAARSRPDAVRARVSLMDRTAARFGSLASRLLPDGP